MMASALIEREIAARPFPIRHGVFLAIVGPSGAGKDTLINYAKDRFGGDTGVEFVRRTVTRDSGGATERHDTLAGRDFDRAAAHGAFAVSWSAHGLKYALPVQVDETVREGRVAVANVSRGVIPVLRERYANLGIVHVTAAPDVLAARLAARGRETREEIARRLARAAGSSWDDAVMIDNSGPLEDAGERLVALIRRAMARAAISDAL
jgi:ribose 1,5-bisphosphokinase